jgi:60S ribosome subunit biogenesis protein NIP7
VCVGKFTHSDKFRLTIGALELLAAHAKHKVSYAAAFGET